MKTKSATTAIYFNKWAPNKEGKCPISIRITYDRLKRLFPTEYALTPDEFTKVSGQKPRGTYNEISLSLKAAEKNAADIIKHLPLFTFEAFEKRFVNNIGAKDTLKHVFTLKLEDLHEAARLGTAKTYECALISLERFHPGVTIAHITPNFLHRYESWMLSQNKSKTTIGIYLRSLRSIINDAIADGLLSKEQYPFGRRKYEIPTGRNIKKALDIQEIEMIFNYQAAPGNEEAAKDFWLFSYMANGMNVKDIALLKFANIKGDYIEFERAKTSNTKRESSPIRVYLSEHLRTIIRKHGNKKRLPDEYIFPILKKNLSPQRQKELIDLKVRNINDWMKIIAQNLGIDKKCTTYVARHSFSTILQRNGFSNEFIGDAVGHTSDETTRNYLAGFEDSRKKEASDALVAFKKKSEIKARRKSGQKLTLTK